MGGRFLSKALGVIASERSERSNLKIEIASSGFALLAMTKYSFQTLSYYIYKHFFA